MFWLITAWVYSFEYKTQFEVNILSNSDLFDNRKELFKKWLETNKLTLLYDEHSKISYWELKTLKMSAPNIFNTNELDKNLSELLKTKKTLTNKKNMDLKKVKKEMDKINKEYNQKINDLDIKSIKNIIEFIS